MPKVSHYQYTELWDKIKDLIRSITNTSRDYIEKCVKKKNSDNSLPLNKIFKLHKLSIVVRFVFQEHEKYYPKVFLVGYLYEL